MVMFLIVSGFKWCLRTSSTTRRRSDTVDEGDRTMIEADGWVRMGMVMVMVRLFVDKVSIVRRGGGTVEYVRVTYLSRRISRDPISRDERPYNPREPYIQLVGGPMPMGLKRSSRANKAGDQVRHEWIR